MAPRAIHEPHDPGPGPGNLYDAPRLAARLGITPATLRQHRAAGAPWLAPPAGTLNGGAVWEAGALADVETRRSAMLHPGRRIEQPAHAAPASAPATAENDDSGFWDDPAPA